MTGSKTRAVLDGIAVCAAASTLAVVFVFHPSTPSHSRVGLDASRAAAMGEPAQRPPRWGVDADFTCGPASPLVTGCPDSGWLTRTLPLDLAGRVLAPVFRPPSPVVDVRLDDGTDRRLRPVPALAATGFLLSPRRRAGCSCHRRSA